MNSHDFGVDVSVVVSAGKAVTARDGSRKVASEAWLADGSSADGAFQ